MRENGLRRAVLMGGGVATALLLGALSAVRPMLAFTAVAVALFGLFALTRRHSMLYLTIVIAFTVQPGGFLPSSLTVGPFNAFLYEPFLLLSALLLLKQRGTPAINRCLIVLAALVIAWTAFGFLQNHRFDKVYNDPRGIVTIAVVIFIVDRIWDTDALPGAINTVKWSLWVSAAVTIGASAGAWSIAGRTEDASLSLGSGAARVATGAERILTGATHVALATLCIVAAFALVGRGSARMWTFAVPALVITLLGFSRNGLLGIAVTVTAVAFIWGGSALVRSAVALTVAATALVATAVLASGASTGLTGYVNRNLSAYEERVIGGLTSSTVSRDTSAQFRVEENELLWADIRRSPIVGHGMGRAFRPYSPYDTVGYVATAGAWYAHNFYLWLWDKAGALGLTIWLWLCLGPILQHRRRKQATGVALSATFLGLMAVSAVAPLPLGATSSIVFGMVMGAVLRSLRDLEDLSLAPHANQIFVADVQQHVA